MARTNGLSGRSHAPTPPGVPSPPADHTCRTLREPAVHRCKQFARFMHLALGAPEPGEAHGGAEFPGFGLWSTRYFQCMTKMSFRAVLHSDREYSKQFHPPFD